MARVADIKMDVSQACRMHAWVSELEALTTERSGMTAANIDRHNDGKAMAYDEGAFSVVAEQMRVVGERLRELAEPADPGDPCDCGFTETICGECGVPR